MSYPAGDRTKAWTWMGFPPPEDYNGMEGNFDERFDKFSSCFGYYFGIGDFSYWNRYAVSSLSREGKTELAKLLLEISLEPTKYSLHRRRAHPDRPYLGLSEEGVLKEPFDPFGDESTFFGTISTEKCSSSESPHNARRRESDRFWCEDCGHWYPNDRG